MLDLYHHLPLRKIFSNLNSGLMNQRFLKETYKKLHKIVVVAKETKMPCLCNEFVIQHQQMSIPIVKQMLARPARDFPLEGSTTQRVLQKYITFLD